ncbi:MAG: sigma-70 family RNA polymerase sigma factor, partial [Candidatus Omnitrophota bacterium]
MAAIDGWHLFDFKLSDFRRKKLANDIFIGGVGTCFVMFAKKFGSDFITAVFGLPEIANLILDIIIVSAVGGGFLYLQRRLRAYDTKVAKFDFFRSLIMSVGAYLIFGLLWAGGAIESFVPSAAVFVILRQFIGEIWAGLAEFPQIKKQYSEVSPDSQAQRGQSSSGTASSSEGGSRPAQSRPEDYPYDPLNNGGIAAAGGVVSADPILIDVHSEEPGINAQRVIDDFGVSSLGVIAYKKNQRLLPKHLQDCVIADMPRVPPKWLANTIENEQNPCFILIGGFFELCMINVFSDVVCHCANKQAGEIGLIEVHIPFASPMVRTLIDRKYLGDFYSANPWKNEIDNKYIAELEYSGANWQVYIDGKLYKSGGQGPVKIILHLWSKYTSMFSRIKDYPKSDGKPQTVPSNAAWALGLGSAHILLGLSFIGVSFGGIFALLSFAAAAFFVYKGIYLLYVLIKLYGLRGPPIAKIKRLIQYLFYAVATPDAEPDPAFYLLPKNLQYSIEKLHEPAHLAGCDELAAHYIELYGFVCFAIRCLLEKAGALTCPERMPPAGQPDFNIKTECLAHNTHDGCLKVLRELIPEFGKVILINFDCHEDRGNLAEQPHEGNWIRWAQEEDLVLEWIWVRPQWRDRLYPSAFEDGSITIGQLEVELGKMAGLLKEYPAVITIDFDYFQNTSYSYGMKTATSEEVAEQVDLILGLLNKFGIRPLIFELSRSGDYVRDRLEGLKVGEIEAIVGDRIQTFIGLNRKVINSGSCRLNGSYTADDPEIFDFSKLNPRQELFVRYSDEFDCWGKARNKKGGELALGYLQTAINLFAQKAAGIAAIEGLSLLGSFARKRARLGIFRPEISFESASRFLIGSKNVSDWDIHNDLYRVYECYPSDADIKIKFRKDIGDNRLSLSSEALLSIQRQIFEQFGVYIHLFYEGRGLIPLNKLIGQGLLARFKIAPAGGEPSILATTPAGGVKGSVISAVDNPEGGSRPAQPRPEDYPYDPLNNGGMPAGPRFLEPTLESWMFRDVEQLLALRDIVESWDKDTVRVWSSACACGEEPISLYILLKSLGKKPEVLGTDISTDMVEDAKSGRRQVFIHSGDEPKVPKAWRNKNYLQWSNDSRLFGRLYLVDFDIRAQVEFKACDMNQPQAAGINGKFDIIIAKNVSLQSAQRRKFFRTAYSMLQPQGLLVLGQLNQEDQAYFVRLGFDDLGGGIFRIGSIHPGTKKEKLPLPGRAIPVGDNNGKLYSLGTLLPFAAAWQHSGCLEKLGCISDYLSQMLGSIPLFDPFLFVQGLSNTPPWFVGLVAIAGLGGLLMWRIIAFWRGKFLTAEAVLIRAQKMNITERGLFYFIRDARTFAQIENGFIRMGLITEKPQRKKDKRNFVEVIYDLWYVLARKYLDDSSFDSTDIQNGNFIASVSRPRGAKGGYYVHGICHVFKYLKACKRFISYISKSRELLFYEEGFMRTFREDSEYGRDLQDVTISGNKFTKLLETSIKKYLIPCLVFLAAFLILPIIVPLLLIKSHLLSYMLSFLIAIMEIWFLSLGGMINIITYFVLFLPLIILSRCSALLRLKGIGRNRAINFADIHYISVSRPRYDLILELIRFHELPVLLIIDKDNYLGLKRDIIKIGRSALMARKVLDDEEANAVIKNGKRVHILVCVGHAGLVKWFLDNPRELKKYLASLEADVQPGFKQACPAVKYGQADHYKARQSSAAKQKKADSKKVHRSLVSQDPKFWKKTFGVRRNYYDLGAILVFAAVQYQMGGLEQFLNSAQAHAPSVLVIIVVIVGLLLWKFSGNTEEVVCEQQIVTDHHGRFIWNANSYTLGSSYRGTEISLQPYFENNWETGFKAFTEGTEIAYYDKKSGKFFTYPVRTVQINGNITWDYKHYYIGSSYKGKKVLLRPFDGLELDHKFRAYYRGVEVANYDGNKVARIYRKPWIIRADLFFDGIADVRPKNRPRTLSEKSVNYHKLIRKGTIKDRRKIDNMNDQEQLEAFMSGKIFVAGYLNARVQIELLRIAAREFLGSRNAVSQLHYRQLHDDRIKALRGRRLRGLLAYYERKLKRSDSSLDVIDFMLEELRMETSSGIALENWALMIRSNKRVDWSKIPIKIQRKLIMKLARQLGKEVSWLCGYDFYVPLEFLGGKSLIGLLELYEDIKKELEQRYPILSEIDPAEFVLLRAGLPTLRQAGRQEQVRFLLNSGSHQNRWHLISAKTKQFIIEHLLKQSGKTEQSAKPLSERDFRIPIAELSGLVVISMYAHYDRIKKAEKIDGKIVPFMIRRIAWEALVENRRNLQIKRAVRESMGNGKETPKYPFAAYAFTKEQLAGFWQYKYSVSQGKRDTILENELVKGKLGIVGMVMQPNIRRMSWREQEEFFGIANEALKEALFTWGPDKIGLDQYIYQTIVEQIIHYLPQAEAEREVYEVNDNYKWARPVLSEFYRIKWQAQIDPKDRALKDLIDNLREAHAGFIKRELKPHMYLTNEGASFEGEINLAVMNCIITYSPERGKFVSKLSWMLKSAVSEVKASWFKEHGMNIPEHIRRKSERIKSVIERLKQLLGEAPAMADVALEIGMSEEEIDFILTSANLRYTDSLDSPGEGEDSRPLIDKVVVKEDQDDSSRTYNLGVVLVKMVDKLDLEYLRMRALEGLSFEQISQQCVITPEQAIEHVREDTIRLLNDPQLKEAAETFGYQDELEERLFELAGVENERNADTPATEFSPRSGAIGKYESIEIESLNITHDNRVEISALIRRFGAKQKEEISIHGIRAPPESFYGFSRLNIPVIDDAIALIMADIAEDPRAVLVKIDGSLEIPGFAALYGGAPVIGLHSSIFDNPVAQFHELGHAANITELITVDDILEFVIDREFYGQKLIENNYTSESAPESVKCHYALRALQHQVFHGHDEIFHQIVSRHERTKELSWFEELITGLNDVFCRLLGRMNISIDYLDLFSSRLKSIIDAAASVFFILVYLFIGSLALPASISIGIGERILNIFNKTYYLGRKLDLGLSLSIDYKSIPVLGHFLKSIGVNTGLAGIYGVRGYEHGITEVIIPITDKYRKIVNAAFESPNYAAKTISLWHQDGYPLFLTLEGERNYSAIYFAEVPLNDEMPYFENYPGYLKDILTLRFRDKDLFKAASFFNYDLEINGEWCSVWRFPGVYHISDETQCLYKKVADYITSGASVCDVGCGTGIQSLAAKCHGAGRIVALDINPMAIIAAKYNTKGYRKLSVRGPADMLAELKQGEKFDIICANCPIDSSIEPEPDTYALSNLFSPGNRFMRALLTGGKQRLTRKGVFIIANIGERESALKIFAELDLEIVEESQSIFVLKPKVLEDPQPQKPGVLSGLALAVLLLGAVLIFLARLSPEGTPLKLILEPCLAGRQASLCLLGLFAMIFMYSSCSQFTFLDTGDDIQASRLSREHPDIMELFTDINNLRDLIHLGSKLRQEYPLEISVSDPRPPLQFALDNGIYTNLFGNVYITPITESFRRMMIFVKQGRIVPYAMEFKMTGDQFEYRRHLLSESDFDVAADMIRNFGPEAGVARPIFKLRNPDCVIDAYGRRIIYTAREPLVITAFEYYDGKRLENIGKHSLSLVQAQALSEGVLSILARLHALGWMNSGLKACVLDGQKITAPRSDIHRGNFRLIYQADGTVRVMHVADFGIAFNNPELAQEQLYCEDDDAIYSEVFPMIDDLMSYFDYPALPPHNIAEFNPAYREKRRGFESFYAKQLLAAKVALNNKGQVPLIALVIAGLILLAAYYLLPLIIAGFANCDWLSGLPVAILIGIVFSGEGLHSFRKTPKVLVFDLDGTLYDEDFGLHQLGKDDELKEAFCALKGLGYSLAVWTNNCQPYTGRILDSLGIGQYFDAVISAHDMAKRKPALCGFIKICSLLEVNPEECICFGNSYTADIAPALGFGASGVSVSGPEELKSRLNELINLGRISTLSAGQVSKNVRIKFQKLRILILNWLRKTRRGLGIALKHAYLMADINSWLSSITIIRWAKYILKNFNGCRIVFMGGACEKAWQAAKYLSNNPENLIYLELPVKALRQLSDDDLLIYLESAGLFKDSNVPLVLVDNGRLATTITRLQEVIAEHYPRKKVLKHLLFHFKCPSCPLSLAPDISSVTTKRNGLWYRACEYLEYGPRARRLQKISINNGQINKEYLDSSNDIRKKYQAQSRILELTLKLVSKFRFPAIMAIFLGVVLALGGMRYFVDSSFDGAVGRQVPMNWISPPVLFIGMLKIRDIWPFSLLMLPGERVKRLGDGMVEWVRTNGKSGIKPVAGKNYTPEVVVYLMENYPYNANYPTLALLSKIALFNSAPAKRIRKDDLDWLISMTPPDHPKQTDEDSPEFARRERNNPRLCRQLYELYSFYMAQRMQLNIYMDRIKKYYHPDWFMDYFDNGFFWGLLSDRELYEPIVQKAAMTMFRHRVNTCLLTTSDLNAKKLSWYLAFCLVAHVGSTWGNGPQAWDELRRCIFIVASDPLLREKMGEVSRAVKLDEKFNRSRIERVMDKGLKTLDTEAIIEAVRGRRSENIKEGGTDEWAAVRFMDFIIGMGSLVILLPGLILVTANVIPLHWLIVICWFGYYLINIIYQICVEGQGRQPRLMRLGLIIFSFIFPGMIILFAASSHAFFMLSVLLLTWTGLIALSIFIPLGLKSFLKLLGFTAVAALVIIFSREIAAFLGTVLVFLTRLSPEGTVLKLISEPCLAGRQASLLVGFPVLFGLVQNGAVSTRTDEELRKEIIKILIHPVITVKGLRPVWRETLQLYYLKGLTVDDIKKHFDSERLANVYSYRCDGVRLVAQALGESRKRVYRILEAELARKIVEPVLTKERLANLRVSLADIITELLSLIESGWVIGGFKFTKENLAVLKAYYVDKQNMPAIILTLGGNKNSVFSKRKVATKNLIGLLVRYEADADEIRVILNDMAPVRAYSGSGKNRRGPNRSSGICRSLKQLSARIADIRAEMPPVVSETRIGLDFTPLDILAWEEGLRKSVVEAVAKFRQEKEAQRLVRIEENRLKREEIARNQEAARLQKERELKVRQQARHEQDMWIRAKKEIQWRQICIVLEMEALAAKKDEPKEEVLSDSELIQAQRELANEEVEAIKEEGRQEVRRGILHRVTSRANELNGFGKSEEELLASYRWLVEIEASRVARHYPSLELDDLQQIASLTVSEVLRSGNYDHRRSLTAYLRGAIRNGMRDAIKTAMRTKNQELYSLQECKYKEGEGERSDDVPDPSADGAFMEALNKEYRRLVVARAGLSSRQRLVYELVVGEQYTYAEAAEFVGVKVKTIDNILSRARKKITRAFEEIARESSFVPGLILLFIGIAMFFLREHSLSLTDSLPILGLAGTIMTQRKSSNVPDNTRPVILRSIFPVCISIAAVTVVIFLTRALSPGNLWLPFQVFPGSLLDKINLFWFNDFLVIPAFTGLIYLSVNLAISISNKLSGKNGDYSKIRKISLTAIAYFTGFNILLELLQSVWPLNIVFVCRFSDVCVYILTFVLSFGFMCFAPICAENEFGERILRNSIKETASSACRMLLLALKISLLLFAMPLASAAYLVYMLARFGVSKIIGYTRKNAGGVGKKGKLSYFAPDVIEQQAGNIANEAAFALIIDVHSDIPGKNAQIIREYGNASSGTLHGLNASKILLSIDDVQSHGWRNIFGNDNPLEVEVGFKYGEYLLYLAKNNPDVNYVGVELDCHCRRRNARELIQDIQKMGLSNIRLFLGDASV